MRLAKEYPGDEPEEVDELLLKFIDECLVELIIRSLQQHTDETEEQL